MRTFRLAVIADVHGNLPALEAVLSDIQKQDVDAVASAGDMTSGTAAEEVVARVRERARWSIAGNHERYYAPRTARPADRASAPPDGVRPGRQWAPQRWCYERLSRATLQALSQLPEQEVIRVDGADPIRLVHGAPSGIADHLYPDREPTALAHLRRAGMLPDAPPPLRTAIADVPEPVIVCGHSHIPWVQVEGKRLVVNAGAAGGSINGDSRAQYAILTWKDSRWHAAHRAVPYDLERVRESYVTSGYLAEGGAFAYALLRNIETGLAWTVALLRHVFAHAQAVGWEDGTIPDDVWDEGVATFDWTTYPEPEVRTRP